MKVVSLFAGCGGLDLGFEKAGVNVVWANEYDESIHSTYRLNHPNTTLNTSDIRTLSGADIPDCDGIIGGPPCQAWSEGGKRLGLKDSRGQLFLDYIRIVREKQPKFFLIENVQGILDDEHKDSLNWFLSLLNEAGYNVSYELLNAAKYKIPQDRLRVFFIGVRKDIKVNIHFPDEVCSTPITLRQAIGDIREEPRYFNDNPVDGANTLRANHDVYTGSYDHKYMSRNRVRSWNEPSFTIQAQARNVPQHPKAPKMTYVASNLRSFAKGYERLYRRLSIRECARIQTFPDTFVFKYTDIKDGYKMVGNAVPPRLAWYLAKQIINAFSTTKGNNTDTNYKFDVEFKHPTIAQIASKYPQNLIVSNAISQDVSKKLLNKHVLIGLIPHKSELGYLNHTAKLYYTGRKFPSTIQLEEMFYFMPYIKGKGIKDLYLIKLARVGSKYEINNKNPKGDIRIIFEIEYLKNLFDKYIPIHLNVWHTFTDTMLDTLQNLNEV